MLHCTVRCIRLDPAFMLSHPSPFTFAPWEFSQLYSAWLSGRSTRLLFNMFEPNASKLRPADVY